jgi:predicted MFS family arabinose efflux permease
MNPWRGLGILPREVWILSIAVLINRMGTMARPFLVLYLSKALGYTAAQAGLALTMYGIGALVTAPLAGRLSDAIRPFRLIKFSLIFTGLILLLFPMVKSFFLILAITLSWAIVNEAFRPASLALIADLVLPEHRKAAFALNRLAINIGMSIGPAAGGYLLLISYPIIFWVDGLTSLAAGLLLIFIPWRGASYEHSAAAASSPIDGTRTRQQSPLRDKRLIYFLIAAIPAMMVFFQDESSMPLFLVRDLDLEEHVYGILFTINTVLIIMIEVPLNLAMSKWPHRSLLALGALLIGAGFGAMALATGFWSITLTVVIWTFGEMIFFPGTAAYMADIAPAERRGQYMGMFQMTFSLAFASGTWLGVALLDQFGAFSLWTGTFFAGVLSAAMFWRVDTKSST